MAAHPHMEAHPKSPARSLRSCCLAVILLQLAAPLSAEPPQAPEREPFLVAYRAAEAGLSAPEADDTELRRHPLYAWLQALRLRQALANGGEAAEADALAFLDQQGEAPVTLDLRKALLSRMAERQDWTAFLARWRDSISDPALRCRALDAWLATGPDHELTSLLAERWVKEAELPAECAGALAWLKTQPVYNPALIERRLRSRLREGDIARARALLAELPAGRRPPLAAWLQLLEAPAEGFTALAAGQVSPADDEALIESFGRYARRDSARARSLLPDLLGALKPAPATAQGLIVAVALSLSWSRDPAALALFKQAGDSGAAIDERAHEWRLRSAIWAGDWAQVLAWTAQLPPALAAQPRWRYWKARSLESLRRPTEAGALYAALAREFDTYGLLAAWRLGQAWTPPSRKVAVVDGEARAALEALPSFVRARAAWQLQLRSIASLEWRASYEALDARYRPALVPIASEWGWYDQAVVTATRQSLYDDVPALFPRPYRDQVEAAASLSGAPSAWIYGVMRKESVFKADAVSSADAIGLLQLLPATAKLVAKRFQQPAPSRDQLFDPTINLPLGALHLRELVDQYQGRWIQALAAYNAGPRAADRWRPADAARDADVWIENVPYNETRSYIQRILLHVAAYRWLETGKPVRANNWLPPIPAVTAP